MNNTYTTTSSTHSNHLSERQKMLSGQPYLAISDVQLVKDRLRVRPLLQRYNNHPWPSNEADDPEPDYFGPDERRAILAELFGIQLDDIKNRPIEIEPPFYCDYGTNITFKGPFYSNFNCHILDCATVTFGSRVIVGPGVHIYAGTHSTDVTERKQGLERAYPVTVGDDVWIGGGAIIVGPCTIGNGTTIAAGAVVRGNVPSNVVMGGVPAKIIKRLENKTSAPKDRSSTTHPIPAKPRPSRPLSTTTTPPRPAATRDRALSSTRSQTSHETVDPATECFLANIPPNLRPSDLKTTLRKYGEVRGLTLDRVRHLGFVRYDTATSAEKAVEAGRGPDGLVVTVDDGISTKRVVVGIERRRSPDDGRSFNAALITTSRCAIRNVMAGEELKMAIEKEFGPLKLWSVSATHSSVFFDFEHLSDARAAVGASRDGDGISLAGEQLHIESRRPFSSFAPGPHSGRMGGGFRRGGGPAGGVPFRRRSHVNGGAE